MRPLHPTNYVNAFQGTTWPVVQRELRSGARKPFNYWIRVAGGIGALFVFYINFRILTFTNPYHQGPSFFGYLHILCMVMILTFVPAMTADCIAKERRDGTLGLLRLTPLTATGVVIGKGLVQTLRAWNIWLSIMPAFAICLLMGGITWQNLGMALLVQLTAIIVGVGAGLSASSFTNSRNIAVFTAEILSWGVMLIIAYLTGRAFMGVLPSGPSGLLTGITPLAMALLAMIQMSGFDAAVVTIMPPNPRFIFTVICNAHFVLAILFLLVALHRAARHVQNSWQDKPPSQREQWFLQKFCTDLLRARSRRKLQRTLDWNPIDWLQQYSWKSRLGKWGLCLLFAIIEALAMNLSGRWDTHDTVTNVLLTILAAAITYIGINSFFEEKRSGALELILVSPISVNSIIWGRAFGIWKQALPSLISLLIYEFGLILMHGRNSQEHSPIFPGICLLILASLPFFATYAALRVRWIFGAALLTWIAVLVGLGFGFGIELTVSYYANIRSTETPSIILFWCTVSYAGLVALTFFLLRHSLSRRIYSF